MNITTRTGLVGFFLALSAIPIPSAKAAIDPAPTADVITQKSPLIESRLTRLTTVIRQREMQLPPETSTPKDVLLAGGWGNGGGGGFANRSGPGGFINNRGGGGFVNGGFRNGGGFWNY
jgi:rSAM-associated Gly-rich repeat protein